MNTNSNNLLYRLAAIGGVLVGIFLLLGAYGHLAAVLPAISSESGGEIVQQFALLLPGLLLFVSGVLNAALCKYLWDEKQWSLQLALLSNVVVLTYLGYLLWKGVPDHPVGMFLAMVASHVVLLGATRVGLVWPKRNVS